jgi:hypothetical protein
MCQPDAQCYSGHKLRKSYPEFRRELRPMTDEQTISYALQITLIGMTLVFMAIVVLWGLILLVVRLTAQRAIDLDLSLTPGAE